MRIDEQVVLVTGAGRGLGAAIATAFGRAGARVMVNYRRSAEAAVAVAAPFGDRAAAVRADVTDAAAVFTMLGEAEKHFGTSVTTVVHNALSDFRFNGDARPKIGEIAWTDFAPQMEVSLHGALNLIQAAAPAMAARGFGRIVTIGTNLFHKLLVVCRSETRVRPLGVLAL